MADREESYDDILAGIPGSGGDNYDDLLAGVTPAKPASPLRDSFKRLYAANPVAAEKAFRGLISTPEGRQKVAPFLPAIGGTIGTTFAPGLGTAAGAGAGDLLRQMIEVEGGKGPVPGESYFDVRSGAEAAGATALGGFPESRQAVNMLGGAARGAGRRALGFTKRFLSKNPRQLAEANRTAQEMLDLGVIRPFSGTEATLERALGAGQSAGKVIGKTIDDLEASGQMAVRPTDIISDVEGQLAPKFGGGSKLIFDEGRGGGVPLLKEVKIPEGAYGKTRGIVNEVKDTIKAHGGVGYASPQEIGFKSLQKLKEKLADIGRFVPGTVDERQQLFQRATGIARKAQDRAVSRAATPETAATYKGAKRIYGESEKAIAGLTNRLSSEKGNLQLGLLDTILATGSLASGNLAGAAATLGIKKALDRAGSGTIAAIADSLAKSGLKRSAANSIFQTIIAGLESE